MDGLPNYALEDISLFPATQEQIIESRKRTATQWARGRSLEEYFKGEEIMDKREHAIEGKYRVWVLAPRNEQNTLDFLCSCETFRRTAIVANKSQTEEDAQIDEVTGYGIASVFTPPQNRKKGYARHMMRLLHWILAPRSALSPTFPAAWGAPPDTEMLKSLGVANAQFSVLYSDIGPNFYRTCGTDDISPNGWVATGTVETGLKLETMSGTSVRTGFRIRPVKRLTEDEVIALYEHDAQWIKDDLSFAPKTPSIPPQTRFTFLPDNGVGAFVIHRLVEFTPDLTGTVLPTSQWGAVIIPSTSTTLSDALDDIKQADSKGHKPGLAFISWTFDSIRGESPPTLVVARLRADEETFPVLLDELLGFAHEKKAGKVEFWYLRPELCAIAEARGWKTKARTEHLSAVKWYGDEAQDELEWVYNEKFCWC